jgi:hypothetical protein
MRKDSGFHIKATREFRDRFMKYCKKYNLVFARRIRVLMEKDMAGKIK